jgi:hypothetical protein
MYDKTTWFRVVPANQPWDNMTKDQVFNRMCGVWDRPQNCAISHIKAGIAQCVVRGFLTQEEAAVNLKETLKARSKAKRKEVAS